MHLFWLGCMGMVSVEYLDQRALEEITAVRGEGVEDEGVQEYQ